MNLYIDLSLSMRDTIQHDMTEHTMIYCNISPLSLSLSIYIYIYIYTYIYIYIHIYIYIYIVLLLLVLLVAAPWSLATSQEGRLKLLKVFD